MHETKYCPTIIPRSSNAPNSTSGFKSMTSEIRGISRRVPTGSRHFEVTSAGQRCYVTPANGSNTIHDIVHFVDRLSRCPPLPRHGSPRPPRIARETFHGFPPFSSAVYRPTKMERANQVSRRSWWLDGGSKTCRSTWLIMGNRKLRLYYRREEILYEVIRECIRAIYSKRIIVGNVSIFRVYFYISVITIES